MHFNLMRMFQTYYLVFCTGIAFVILTIVTRELVISPEQPLSKGINFLSRFKQTSGADRPPGTVYVLVLTYMRSGSSFTGDILQQASEAFFVFEPLRKFYGERDVLSTEIVTNTDEKAIIGARAVIRNWFMCSTNNISESYLREGFLSHGKKTSKFRDCTLKGGKTFPECRQLLHQLCLNSPVRIIKTIRMTLREARALLEELPNLYIIHLVRDPRGTINSQRKLGKCGLKFGGESGCTNLLCKRLENDVYEEEKMLADYPGRIMPVLYGDVASRPIETAKKMFEFLGQEFTGAAETYIHGITHAETQSRKVVSTSRRNSSEHVESWKNELTPSFVKLIEDRCNYILRRYHLKITNPLY